MKIKTVQIQGLTPSRLHPGKGWEPGWEVGGDQGNGLLDKVGRRLWAALLGAIRLALGDNQSRLPARGWETSPPQVQPNKAAHPPLCHGFPDAATMELSENCDNSFY